MNLYTSFKIAMFLRMLTYAQKWLNSYVFYAFIVHGNITANQLFAPKLPLKIPFYFKISLTLFWIIVGSYPAALSLSTRS